METEYKTVVYLDMARYSAISRILQEGHGLGVPATVALNEQIRHFVQKAVTDIGFAFGEVFCKGTGDGAILCFPDPTSADRFAVALHRRSDEHNKQRSHDMEMRLFRVGIYTGELGHTIDGDIAGTVIGNAARLESAADVGEVLIDAASWESLPEAQKSAYGLQEAVRGKDHDPIFHVYRRRVIQPLRPEGDQKRPENEGRGGNPLSKNEEAFVENVINSLGQNPIVLLLGQDGREDSTVLAELWRRLEINRKRKHVMLPGSAVPFDRYFESIARQCGFGDGVFDAVGWHNDLDERLEGGETFVLLITGFEESLDKRLRQMGRSLHALSQKHRPSLWVVLSGGENLAALKYKADRLSVLWSATRLDWPEPNADDVLAWQRREQPELTLTVSDAEDILSLCGAHPRLVRTSFDSRRLGKPVYEALLNHDSVWQIFTSLGDGVCDLLKNDDLGAKGQWIREPLLRRLFWTNALAEREGRLTWRCDIIRHVGLQILGCD